MKRDEFQMVVCSSELGEKDSLRTKMADPLMIPVERLHLVLVAVKPDEFKPVASLNPPECLYLLWCMSADLRNSCGFDVKCAGILLPPEVSFWRTSQQRRAFPA